MTTITTDVSAGQLLVVNENMIYDSDFLGSFPNFQAGNNGRMVRSITLDGLIDTVYLWQNRKGVTGTTFDDYGNFYVSHYSTNQVIRINKDGVESNELANINGPTAVLHHQGELFIAVGGYSKYPLPGKHIYRISKDGDVQLYATSDQFNGANGMVMDSYGHLFVANWFTGVIHRITPTGDVSEFVQIPGGAGWLTIYNDILYVCSRLNHQIYSVDQDAKLTVIAGSGKRGYKDGQAKEAEFDRPNGIAISKDGSTLFVSETEARRIRKISLR